MMRLTTPIIVVCSLFWRARSSQGNYGHAEMRTGRQGLPPAAASAADLAFDNASHHFVLFQDKMDKEAKRTSIVGEGALVQPIWRGYCSATHRERTLYWILGKLFSNSLPASCSITHKRVDAENIGILLHPAPFYRLRHPD